jgi:hypothetical protein
LASNLPNFVGISGFPIELRKEQDVGPFNWIITGSAGIGTWVAKKHLVQYVFDLPLFAKEDCFQIALDLCYSLNINLSDGIDGIPYVGIEDWLDEPSQRCFWTFPMDL